MKITRIIQATVLVLASLVGVAQGQPVTQPGIRAVQHGAEMAGSGTTTAPLTLTHTCGVNEILKWDGANWICAGLASGSVSGTGTNGKVARFSGISTIADASISDNGSRAVVT